MGVEGGVGQAVALSHQESPLRQGKVLHAGAVWPVVWGEEAIHVTVSVSAGIVAASFVNLGRCDCE